MSIVERTIPIVLNPTQGRHIPSFVPEMAESENIVGDELVPSTPPPRLSPTLVNDNYRVEFPQSLYIEWGWKACVYKSFTLVSMNM